MKVQRSTIQQLILFLAQLSCVFSFVVEARLSPASKLLNMLRRRPIVIIDARLA